MNLDQLIDQTEQLAKQVSFENEISKYYQQIMDKEPKVINWWRKEIHYKCLAALTTLLKVQRACEVGTMYGNGAIALAKGSRFVTCYDIDLSNYIFNEPYIRPIKIRPIGCLDITYSQYDFVYIDIGQHDGELELQIHRLMLQQQFKGIVCYDDIDYETMQPFWKQIENEKIATSWRQNNGFGVVLYD